MSELSSSSDPQFSGAFNERKRLMLLKNAEQLRLDLLDSAFRLFQEFALEDIDTREHANGRTVRLWLSPDLFALPETRDGRPQHSVSFAVQSGDETRKRRLLFHIPVPETFDVDDIDQVDNLSQPEALYTERVEYLASGAGRTVVRYCLSEYGTHPYESIVDEPIEDSLYTSDRVLLDELHGDFDSGLPLLTGFYQDLINWQAVRQRSVTRQADGGYISQDI